MSEDKKNTPVRPSLDLDPASYKDDASMLEAAIRNEQNGLDYYHTMAKKYADHQAAVTFRVMGEQEDQHIEYLNQLKAHYEGKGHVESLGAPDEVDFDFGDFTDDSSVVVSVFSVGMSLEMQAVRFYSKASEKAQDPEAKKLYKELVKWENYHMEQLRGQYELYREQWYGDMGFSRI